MYSRRRVSHEDVGKGTCCLKLFPFLLKELPCSLESLSLKVNCYPTLSHSGCPGPLALNIFSAFCNVSLSFRHRSCVVNVPNGAGPSHGQLFFAFWPVVGFCYSLCLLQKKKASLMRGESYTYCVCKDRYLEWSWK